MSTATIGRATEYLIRDIPGTPGYGASSDGRIWSKHKEAVQHLSSHGYPSVTIRVGGKWTKISVHILVAAAWLGPRPDGLEVCHGNNDKLDNRVENLRYDTHAGNMADTVRDRTHCRNGHLFDEANTYMLPSGGRNCRKCRAVASKASRIRRGTRS